MVAATRTSRRGFTLIEAVISVVIVSLMMAAAMQAAGGAGLMQYRAQRRALAAFYARAMLSEVLVLDYQDAGANPVFGRETGELATSRSNYNDVDDYAGYTETPLTDRDGKAIPDTTGWTRSVEVVWVNTSDLTTAAGAETGAKRITVTVQYNGVTLATRTAIRTHAP